MYFETNETNGPGILQKYCLMLGVMMAEYLCLRPQRCMLNLYDVFWVKRHDI